MRLGRSRLRSEITRWLGVHHADLFTATDLLGPEVDTYAEIILDPAGAGFVTRGRGEGFLVRSVETLDREGRASAAAATLMKWVRQGAVPGFARLYWAREPKQAQDQMRGSFCLRSRLPIQDVSSLLGEGGSAQAALERWAAMFQVTHAHFVGLATCHEGGLVPWITVSMRLEPTQIGAVVASLGAGDVALRMPEPTPLFPGPDADEPQTVYFGLHGSPELRLQEIALESRMGPVRGAEFGRQDESEGVGADEWVRPALFVSEDRLEPRVFVEVVPHGRHP